MVQVWEIQANANSCENICCKQQPCITTVDIFSMNVLNTDVLSIAILGQMILLTYQNIHQHSVGRLPNSSGSCGSMGI